MSSITRVGAYLVLCWLLQMVLDLSNQGFILLFLIGTLVIFIITSLTHTHDIDAEETAIKVEEKVEKVVDTITYIGEEVPADKKPLNGGTSEGVGSGHRAPEGF